VSAGQKIGLDTFLLSGLIRMKTKPGFALNNPAGKKPATFMLPALSAGEDIWKACASYARLEKVKRLGVKGTGNNYI
jgi:hypothetical protein